MAGVNLNLINSPTAEPPPTPEVPAVPTLSKAIEAGHESGKHLRMLAFGPPDNLLAKLGNEWLANTTMEKRLPAKERAQ